MDFSFLSKRVFLPLNIMVDQCSHFMADMFSQCDPVRKTTLACSLLAGNSEQSERALLGTPVLWEQHIETQRTVCSRYVKKRSRKTMALKSHEKVSLCQRVEKQPI